MNQTLTGSQIPTATAGSPRVDMLGVAHVALSATATFTCLCGTVGSGTVVWLLGCRAQRTPFCVYVLHLAVADLLLLLCTVSTLTLSATLPAHEVLQRVKYATYTMGLSLLTAISVQRCLSVLFPIWYKRHRPQHLSAAVCALLWALSLLVNVLASFFCLKSWHLWETPCFVAGRVLGTLIMGVFTPVTVLSSGALCVRVQGSSRRRPMRLYEVVLVSVLGFLVCTLPLGIHTFLLYWLHLPQRTKTLLSDSALLSSAMSCSANPVIYFLVGSRGGRHLREPLRAVLQRALREEPELEAKETVHWHQPGGGLRASRPADAHAHPARGLSGLLSTAP